MLRLALRFTVVLTAVLLGLASAQTAPAIPTGSYQLLPAQSKLAILLRKSGLLSAFADNHLILAGAMSGSAEGSKGAWSGTVTAPTAKLEVADPGRSAKDRQSIWATMEGPDQLDAAHYPTIVWHLSSIAPTTSGPGYLLRGSFTLHGITRTVAWPTHLQFKNGTVRVWGQATMKLTDFGIQPIRRALGTVRVKDQFVLRWDTVWQRS